MTILESLDNIETIKIIKKISKEEFINFEELINNLKNNYVVIPKNVNHKFKKIKAIGKGLSTKINANLGTSKDRVDLKFELKKLKIAVKYGADSVMDLSTAGDIDLIRRKIIEHSPVMVGTVPIYQIAIESVKKFGAIKFIDKSLILEILEKQAADGVDFFTIHCGITLKALDILKKDKRLLNIVSRGGSFIAEWMIYNNKENPFYEYFDDVLKIAKKYDVTLSLGDGLRPGCIFDSTDKSQIAELITLGELTEKCKKEKVQVMIEGPGHMPMNEIEANVLLQKKLCANVPFYVLGPLVIDTAAGYDHIVSAIGGAIAAAAGADFLCYVTPAEHLKLPDINDVKEGVIAAKIAAEAADIVKNNKKIINKNYALDKARRMLDWNTQKKYIIDPYKFSKFRKKYNLSDNETCSMCADLCAIKKLNQFLNEEK
ncbi:MAG TPA: phosphomethylpyrimidine synthase ThiC [bacterium]|nr:phosphomethylpyrimidine synthase ThiC [bacterium]HOL48215.1 phosphomethylpyrimidine synthase ThiC [bacterium]HPQ18915.1 phosphomethylpyrimidine synthase ThiC [bacterium]